MTRTCAPLEQLSSRDRAARRSHRPARAGILTALAALLAATSVAAPLHAQPDDRRQQDYRSAPYAAAPGDPSAAGEVHALDALAPAARTLGRRFLLGDEVRVVLPAAAVPSPGARFLTVSRERGLADGTVILRPTGVIEVLEFEGAFVRGRVVQLLDLMEAGQPLVPLPSASPAAAGAAGGTAYVRWTDGGARLLSLQDWLLLRPTDGSALVEGDVVALVEPVRDAAGAEIGEQTVATARVVRVSTHGASAMITAVRRPVVRVGTLARVVSPPR